MTYDEFQQQVSKAGLTLQDFADVVHMNRTSLYNYGKAGEVPAYVAVIAVLMREMEARGIDYRALLAQADIAPQKSRKAESENFGGIKK